MRQHHLNIALVITWLLQFESCGDAGLNDGGAPPCIDCPIDFRVTDFQPAWSPDGNTIAYVHGDTIPGTTGIYLIEPSGLNKRLWYASVGASAPDWSPDGLWIAFHDRAQIYKRKLDGDSLTQLTTEGRNFFPSWSPGGEWMAYDNTDCGNAIEPSPPNACGALIMSSDGSNRRFIARGRMPDVSPDGDFIVLIGSRSEIYRVSILDTSQMVRLTSFNQGDPYSRRIAYPKYSPHGMKIAFTSQPPGLATQTQIWVMNADGSDPQQLTTTQGYTCDWSADGEWIVFTDSRAVSGRLWIMRKDGSEKRQLTFD